MTDTCTNQLINTAPFGVRVYQKASYIAQCIKQNITSTIMATTPEIQTPVILTGNITSIDPNTASCSGNLVSRGKYGIVMKGICWSTSPSPVLSDNKTLNGKTLGTFDGSMPGLIEETTYYVRAYVTDTAGVTTYGAEKSFVTESSALTGYFVSAGGNDSNDGRSMDRPWKTLTKVNAFTPSPGDNIYFRRGDEWYGTLTPKAEGNWVNPITYGAYGTGARPVITGFVTITGWVNEGNGIYSKAITSDTATNMVTINNNVQAMGRYPIAGQWLTYESLTVAPPTNTLVDTSLSTTPNDWSGAEAVVYMNGWDINRHHIDSHVGNTLTMTNLVYSGSPMKEGDNPHYYFIQNDIRTLTRFGDWYHDFSNGKFYMYFGAANPSASVVKVATKTYVVRDFNGHKYISYKDLEVTGGINSNILLYTGQDYCDVKGCSIKYSGGAGIKAYGAHDLIENNTFSDIHGGGVILYTTDQAVLDNTFTNTSMAEGQGANQSIWRGAITQYNATNITVNNNIIINVGFDGIMMGSNVPLTATIKNNYVENACYWRQDQGAIYTSGGQALQTSVLIEGNIVRGSYGDGIYCDEYSTNVTVKDNTVEGSLRGGIFLHKGNGNTITGNTLFNNASGLKMANWLNENNLINIIFTDNIVVAKTTDQYCISYTTRYTNYVSSFLTWNFTNNVYGRPINNTTYIKTDIYGQGILYKTLAEWKALTNKDLNAITSPKSIGSMDDVYLYYNETLVNKTIQLPQPSLDMYGTRYSTSITLPTFTSEVLLRDGNSYFVSNSGNDSNNGLTEQTPWKTIQKVSGFTFAPGDEIKFKGGETFYGSLTINQSGLENKLITYTSYGTGQATISGLANVTSWNSLGNNIWESAAAVSTLSYLNLVLIDGINTPMGRIPKIDNVYIYQTHSGDSSITSTDLTETPNWTGAEVVLRKRGWAYEKSVVTGQIGGTITFSGGTIYTINYDNCGFFFQADPKCLTQQNDWYYNPITKKLRIYSVVKPSNVQVPTTDNLVTMYNRDYISFKNIKFTGSNKNGVFLNTSDNCIVDSCTMDKMGWYGVTSYDDHYNTINNNTINDCNHCGIKIGGGTNTNSIITSNIITNTHLIPGIGPNAYSLGAICVTGDNPLVQYNDINYSGYNGIIVSDSATLIGTIKNNFINNSLQKLSDGGGIYTARNHTGLVIEKNIVLNSLGFTLGAPNQYNGATGIYLDIHSTNVTVKDNIVSGCNVGMCMGAYNVNNTFNSNIVFDNLKELSITNIAGGVLGATNNNIVINNKLVTKVASQIVAQYQSSFSEDIENFFSNIDNNIYARPIDDTNTIWFYQPSIIGPSGAQPLSVWRTFIGQDINSIDSPYSIATENDVYMIYNKNKISTNISIPYTSKTLDGVIHSTQILLQPFTGLILFKV